MVEPDEEVPIRFGDIVRLWREKFSSDSKMDAVIGMDFAGDEAGTTDERLLVLARALEMGIITTREAAEGFEAGDLVIMNEDGTARRNETPIGVALDGDRVALGGFHASVARYGSMAMHVGSIMMAPGEWGFPRVGGRQFQYTEKFPQEVRDRAWKLVEEEMSSAQYFAFMEGADIELENLVGDFRLIINKSGKFTILEGARGAGIVASSGNVRSYKYPLGDEVSAFIDWFKHRTRELIAQWGCGTYGIVREGERR